MKQSKQSQLIHIWEDYEFYLSTPKTFTGSNKPFIYFYYSDAKANKSQRIRKYISKNGRNIPQIKEEAKALATELATMLSNNWNPITNLQNEVIFNSTSTITTCIDYKLSKREEALENKAIGKKALKNNKILMMHFKSYLEKENLLNIKVKNINNVHIKKFLGSNYKIDQELC